MQKLIHGGRSVAIDEDLPEAGFRAEKHLRVEVQSKSSHTNNAVRGVIEIQRNLGGMRWRAVLGGTWVPQREQSLVLDVGIAYASAFSAEPDCPSLLDAGFPYRVGLIEEFAPRALNGMLEVARQSPFGPGVLVIDRAGFDDESSSIIFRSAGRMLIMVLIALAHGDDPAAAARTERTTS